MYSSANEYTDNRCSLEGQTCRDTYFYALSRYETARCAGGQWAVAGMSGRGASSGGSTGGSGGTGGGSSSGGGSAELCPNGVFGDGMMYDGNVNYTQNRCSLNGQSCPTVYFYALGRYSPAQCSGNVWVPAGG